VQTIFARRSTIWLEAEGISMANRDAFRIVYKLSYLLRGRYRTTRRGVEDSVKLGLIAKELAESYIRVVCWDGFKRVLEVEI